MAGKIHCIDIVQVSFESLTNYSDEQLYHYMLFACRSTKQRFIPKRIHWNAYYVTRSPNAIRINLLVAKEQEVESKKVAQFGFIPGPDFSRMVSVKPKTPDSGRLRPSRSRDRFLRATAFFSSEIQIAPI